MTPEPLGTQTKPALRQQLRAERAALAPRADTQEALAAGTAVAQLLAQPIHQSFWQARTLALYVAIDHELNPAPIAAAVLTRGGAVCYPRVLSRHPAELRFCNLAEGIQMVPGPFGTTEPGPGAPEPDRIDVFIVPGLGFDRGGHRLGYGRGFYDRALCSSPHALRVAVCYPFQVRSHIPHDSHDEPVDLIATPQGVIYTGARPSAQIAQLKEASE